MRVHHRIAKTYCVFEETELVGCSETTKTLCPTHGVTTLNTSSTMNCRENPILLKTTALFWVVVQRVETISCRLFGTTPSRTQFSSTSRRKPEIMPYLLSSLQRIL